MKLSVQVEAKSIPAKGKFIDWRMLHFICKKLKKLCEFVETQGIGYFALVLWCINTAVALWNLSYVSRFNALIQYPISIIDGKGVTELLGWAVFSFS